MAQDRFINVTLDPSASKKPDIENHTHTVSAGANAAAGDLTLSFDSSKITSPDALNLCIQAARDAVARSLPAA
jgi:hypothetical protein